MTCLLSYLIYTCISHVFQINKIIVGDEEIKEGFRFRRATILTILSELDEFISRPTHRCQSIPNLLILCIALRFYACSGYYTLLGDYTGLSKASIHRCIKVVTDGLKEKASKYIKFPAIASLPAIKESFYSIGGNLF